MSNAPLLEITTTRRQPRRTVVIDGKPYPLLNPGGMSYAQTRQLEQLIATAQKGNKAAEPGPEFSNKLAAMVRIILKAPAAVHAALGDVARIQIIDVFGKQFPANGRKRKA